MYLSEGLFYPWGDGARWQSNCKFGACGGGIWKFRKAQRSGGCAEFCRNLSHGKKERGRSVTSGFLLGHRNYRLDRIKKGDSDDPDGKENGMPYYETDSARNDPVFPAIFSGVSGYFVWGSAGTFADDGITCGIFIFGVVDGADHRN